MGMCIIRVCVYTYYMYVWASQVAQGQRIHLPSRKEKSESVSCSVVSNSLRPHGLSMGFSRQEYWNGLPFPSPGDLPNPGIEPRSQHCRQILYCLSYHGSQAGDLGSVSGAGNGYPLQ